MTAKKSKTIELPHILVEAVKEKRAVLVFGAGASKESKDSLGKMPPDGFQLRDALAKKYLGTSNDDRDLMTVSEMAISNGYGEPLVFDEIARLLSGFPPSRAHKRVTQFSWRGLATTNYDTLLESAYSEADNPIQNYVRFVKDSEPYDERLANTINPVPYLKLHGCLDHRLDRDVPLVLTNEHYNRVRANREKLFNRLREWAETSVLIFIGYKVADSHIRDLIYKLDPQRRPQWFIVTPTADDNDERFWASKSVSIIRAQFGEFMDALDKDILPLFRSLANAGSNGSAPYMKHFRSNDNGSDTLRLSLHDELTYVHSGVAFEELSPEKYYSGFETSWCGTVRKYDFTRKAGERMTYAALDVPETDLAPRFFLLQGSAGSGKTIALRRAAYDAATALDEIVLWAEDHAAMRPEVLEELYGLTGKRVVLVVDQISLRAEAVRLLLSHANKNSIPITILAAEREADWATYCDDLEREFPPEVYKLGHLSKAEAEDLVELLGRHKCLGFLEAKSKPDRIAAFLDKDRADRQLLVALHELTLGKPFLEIVSEEYSQISPVAARRLYLDIATMHQFGVIARAGAISRISGVRFSDFEEDFFKPLSDIVTVRENKYTGDKGYVCRHSRVSRMVFGVACPTDEEKARQLARIISGLDPAYSADKRIIEGICKGRQISEQFSSVEHAREIFDMACAVAPQSAFLFQQAAILEYNHKMGSLERADELAKQAREIDGNNHIYLHTLAEVSRRRANVAVTRLMKEKLRGQSRSYLNEIYLQDSRKDLTFCKLLIDEAVDELKVLPESPLDHQLVEFDTKVEEAVSRLQRAKTDHPEEPEFLTAEATLWQQLGEGEKAHRSLQRAAQVRPRNANVYSRLASVSRRVKSPSEAIDVLRSGLEKFPNDKALHQRIAVELLSQCDELDPEVEFHLKSSFSVEDHNFEGRFLLAELLFLLGKIDDCVKLFDTIDKRAPDNFRPRSPKFDDAITQKIERRSGKVEKRQERIFFIRTAGYPSLVFSHYSSLQGQDYDKLREGQEVSFKVLFNRKGPVAVDVKAA